MKNLFYVLCFFIEKILRKLYHDDIDENRVSRRWKTMKNKENFERQE